MIQIRNKQKSPIQLIVRSRKGPSDFTTLNIPGVGKGNNVVYIADEKVTDVIERIEKRGLIETKYIPNSEVVMGE